MAAVSACYHVIWWFCHSFYLGHVQVDGLLSCPGHPKPVTNFVVHWHYILCCPLALCNGHSRDYLADGCPIIYKRGPACRFPDWDKYVFFPRYCVFANIERRVHIRLLGNYLKLHTCPRSHSGQNLFSPAYHLIVPRYYVFGVQYLEQNYHFIQKISV